MTYRLSADEIPERLKERLEKFDDDADGALSAEEIEAMRQVVKQRFEQWRGKGGAERPRRPKRPEVPEV